MLLQLALAAVMTCGCSPQRAPEPVEDTLTSGRITIVCAPEVSSIVVRAVAVFDSLYPGAEITVRTGSSREGVRALFAAECDLAVLTRDLEPEERAAAVRGGLELEGYRFAKDGVAVVVHPANPVENISLEDIGGIYRGTIRSWDAVGGPRSTIAPTLSARGSDLEEFVGLRLMNEDPIGATVVYEGSDSAVVARVARDPAAIGLVGLGWADRGVRALRVAAIKGLSYVRPDAESVHEGDYPLTRSMHLYVRPGGRALANGVVTFITAMEGQKLVLEGGLVPTAVPVRFVRRSPMLGSHE